MAPVDSFAGLVAPLAVSPLMPGSLAAICRTTLGGSSIADGVAVEERDLAVEPLAEEADLVADLVLLDVDLVAGGRVHEDEAVALVPRVGHLARLDVRQLDRLARSSRCAR